MIPIAVTSADIQAEVTSSFHSMAASKEFGAGVAADAKRRRLVGKQSVTSVSLSSAGALADESADDLLGVLSATVKRKHIHWTMVRTHGKGRKQPSDFSREAFFEHLLKVYKLAYPVKDSPTGSILMFAAVAKEKHARAWKSELRDEHLHAPVYCSEQHYWNKVASISREKFGVYLNAQCHVTYTEMYSYIKESSPKKPLCELDPEVFLSPLHPRGEELAALLEAGRASADCRRGKTLIALNRSRHLLTFH